MKVKFYGSKGSIPYFRRDSAHYGANTSCVGLNTNGRTVILDCGSGLPGFFEDMGKPKALECDILIGHLHLDHILGLSMFPPLLDPENRVRIFTKSRSAAPLAEQIFGAFKPPYWPADLTKLNRVELCEIKGPFSLGNGIDVTTYATPHGDDTTAFRIDADRSLVYLLDSEITCAPPPELAAFCKSADLIIFDAAYWPEEYRKKRGWGHSTPFDGMALAESSGCGKMVFSHFSPDYTDAFLQEAEDAFDGERYIFARDGLEMEI